MKRLFDEVSKKCSELVTKSYSTSFSLAVRTLSPTIRGDIYSIYGFVRFADEIVDSFHDYDKETLFNEFEKELYLSIERGISLNPILNSFQEVVVKNSIDIKLVESFMKSMRADLVKTKYNSTEEYEEYIYGSADVVGLMCLKVFVKGEEQKYNELKESAKRLGSAFQKVNFLRDLKSDTEVLDRTYFPTITNEGFNKENKEKIEMEIQKDFDAAYKGVKELPDEAKLGVYTAYKYYYKLFNKMKTSEVETIQSSRIRINNPMKILLLTKSYLDYKLNKI